MSNYIALTEEKVFENEEKKTHSRETDWRVHNPYNKVNLLSLPQLQHWPKKSITNFPGGPMAKTPHSQCRGPTFDSWSGN